MRGLTIEQWPLRQQADDLLAEVYRAQAALHREATPGDPRAPLAAVIAAARHRPAPEDGFVLLARGRGDAVAGLARCTWEQVPGVDHVLSVLVQVLPRCRRQGLGRLLLDRCTAIAEQRGLRLMIGDTRDNVASGGAFCERFGAERALVNQENRLDLGSVDRGLIGRWVADGPARAPGYRLLFVAGRTPPDCLDRVAEVLSVMNTAPHDSLDVSDVQVTPGLVRVYEDADIAAGCTAWAYYAVHEDSGRFAGLTSIVIRPGIGDRVYVENTAVDPAHRGHGLGKWLKAAMTRKILAELPAARWVITWNAASNDAMLAINRNLGFQVHATSTVWQVPAAGLRARLAGG